MAIFGLHDYDDELKKKGAIDITRFVKDVKRLDDVAGRGNKKGYGIFWVLNDFEGARKKENLTKINYWFCDIDNGSKEEQIKRIDGLLIQPSFVVETKNGYHCYWAVEGDASIENFEKIESALIELLDGDTHCKDPLRLLRCPYFYHMKNPKEPFMVTIVKGLGSNKAYTEKQMLDVFCYKKEDTKPLPIPKVYITSKSDFLDENKWEKIFKISNIYKGNRNGTLTRYTFWLKDEGLSSSEIRYVISGINRKLTDPLPERELEQLLRTKI
ncbi:MAG: hypothetical protein IKY45_01060 [Clostridia bacterium]|nr:hypothetical protein [Clostridia bacterium]